MNTFISGAAGALTVFALHYFINMNKSNRYSLVMLCNGNLAGLVAITGPCDNVEGWAAFIIGTMGGFVYVFINRLLVKLEIDDPVDAVPIHLVR
jgi:Amt family ammonium transporter